MLTLAFDTSAAHCAAALLSGERLVASRREDMVKGQAERLMPLLEELLAEAGVTWRDLDRIGVGIGPGNFTGIRISVSAARGLALALGIPAIGVSTLEAQAYGMDHWVMSCLDARQNRAYTQVFYRGVGEAPALSSLDDQSIPKPHLKADCVVTGSFAEEVGRVLNLHIIQNPIKPIEAIARIAAERTPDGSRPAPMYMRPADAAPPKDPAPVILE
ncbi:tRNA threonylcarbamoyl adenosine modification protein YeaZ [Litoreibacter ponti]|uniref:tRNA threonylcarbamoyl adenosine modification protein YeaZ n=1 Tax=Litoreibacter ponti TaxID=1510457 RepID=A0A2T6BM57_9RHOB|nr:tRNA (adenosine(37)-N6)-threonylcarbamoyltransferase complex dimerization subunit type 1 TsaB [Litoreibacter ponti]PTX57132.1 tRNA threonylcarbamoyl adenosine modification protein YeaZ [Litoreibacter ponti]